MRYFDMRCFVFVAALVLAVTVSVAAASNASGTSIDFELIQHGVEFYNASMENAPDNAPDLVKSLLGDERIEINIIRENGTILAAGLYMENALVVKTIEGEMDSPTVVIEGTEDAITRIPGAEDPVKVFQQAWNDDEISITGKTFKAKFKIAAALSSTTLLEFLADMVTR
ncbi:MAG: hypothetical protein ACXQT2_07795 [Methanotrichaceae archaeon]